ncbi:hypothetical protein [Rhodophyticola porphyridii]|uniref:hypothetical protein n=1 Tax=Rhodophyticola porphyridii TaxID=1852017 RepID=UPI0013146155|nr:hypothetical protein [Rhodophyticola porphyridii]
MAFEAGVAVALGVILESEIAEVRRIPLQAWFTKSFSPVSTVFGTYVLAWVYCQTPGKTRDSLVGLIVLWNSTPAGSLGHYVTSVNQVAHDFPEISLSAILL